MRLELLAYSFVLSNMVLMQAGLGHNYDVFMNAFFESINAMSTIISLSGRSICVGRLELKLEGAAARRIEEARRDCIVRVIRIYQLN